MDRHDSHKPYISIGIIARNEEDAIGTALESLFTQSLFDELRRRGLGCEIYCIVNGCTDNTPLIAKWLFGEQSQGDQFKETVRWNVVEVAERGKINAWNLFVHSLSAPASEFFFLMDGDICINEPTTLWNMCEALRTHSEAVVAVDQPRKHIALGPVRSLRHWCSLATSRMTQAAEAQLSGQLYCIRSAAARNIYLPRSLTACEDGFIKAIVCTDFLSHDVAPNRILLAKNASHIFEAYTSIPDILRNQKRQMIGQAIVHILVDDYLRRLPFKERLSLAETLRREEAQDPSWLNRLIAAHLRRTRHFWQLIPGILTVRFKRLARLPGVQKIFYFPAAVAGLVVNTFSCWMAYRFLKHGSTEYWPETRSANLHRLRPRRHPG